MQKYNSLSFKFLLGLFVLIPLALFAHNPSISKTVFKQDRITKNWCVFVSISQKGMIQSLESRNPLLKENYGNDKLWEKYFVAYLKEKIKIYTSVGQAILGNGMVKLGANFEAFFELKNVPKTVNYFIIENSVLNEIYPLQNNLIEIEINKDQIFSVISTPENLRQEIFLNNSFSNRAYIFRNFVIQGFRHVLPLGLDHILFIIALFFLNSNLKSSLIQASMFTLAHSITLIITGLGYVRPNLNFVEPIIAISIAFIAFENIINQQLKKTRLIFIFIFGLIHGLGFANAFLVLELPINNVVNSLIAFNIGVEIAQVVIILFLYFAIAKWLKNKNWYQNKIVIPISVLIFSVSIYWTIQRVFF